ncbi:hypothetical protein B0H10DRAFT_1961832 [Mycena sp. CBHHK59/15]|nr:hypothetical protein B0H10DRAFT_1961832 [Mycena sp. CBHHK59/15]
MRSSRKIGEVVGETPFFVDLSSSSSSTTASTSARKLERARRASEGEPQRPPSSASAATPPDIHVPSTNATARPLLYVRLPTSNETTLRTPVTPSPSPTLTVALNLTQGNEESVRRRKMAKLSRTLGVKVPPELVFSSSPSRQRRRSRQSSILESMPEKAGVKGAVSGRRRRATRSLKDSAGGSKMGRPPSVASSSLTARHPKSDSISHGWVWVGKPTDHDVPANVRVRSSRATAESLCNEWVGLGSSVGVGDKSTLLHPPVSVVRNMHRRENGWSGEWAGRVSNMDDVVRKLRGLRVK